MSSTYWIDQIPDSNRISFSEWIQKFGFNDASLPSELGKSVYTIESLSEGPHHWIFIGCRDYYFRDSSCVSEIMRIMRIHNVWYMKALEIPDDWKCVEDSAPNAVIKSSLQAYLDCLEHADLSRPLLSYKPRSYFTNVPYPSPNVTLHEITDADSALYSVECTILRILSQKDIQHSRFDETGQVSHFPSVLPAVFSQIRGCELLNSVPIAFPAYSSEFGSSMCPNFANRPASYSLPGSLPDNFSPVIFAAQRVESLFSLGEKGSVIAQGLVELSKIFEPALQLLVMHLTKKYQVDDYEWKPEWNPLRHFTTPENVQTSIPEKFFLFGMTYTARSCVVYAFMPRYRVNPSGRVEWSFCCYEAFQMAWHLGAHDYQFRIQLINTLLRIQRHTVELVEIFKEVSLNLSY